MENDNAHNNSPKTVDPETSGVKTEAVAPSGMQEMPSPEKNSGPKRQRTFLFDDAAISLPKPHPAAATATVADTSHPEAAETSPFEKLIRPDRQTLFDGPASEWPTSPHDPEIIVVDHDRTDIDGPPHRFLIKVGDLVEIFISAEDSRIGEVRAIFHEREEVEVSFTVDGTDAQHFHVSQVYPAPPDSVLQESPPPNDAPESLLVESLPHATAEPLPASLDATTPTKEAIPHEPYTLEAFREYRKRYENGLVSLDEHKSEFSRVRATQSEFVAQLKGEHDATKLKVLAARFGSWDAKRNTKEENAKDVVKAVLHSFSLGETVCYSPMSETFEDALTRQVEALTEDDWSQYFKSRAENQEAKRKAHENPETIAEFRTFVSDLGGAEHLSDEQLVRFDELLADETRAARKAKTPETVTQITSDAATNLTFTIKEGFHDRHKIPLWIVQLTDRVDRQLFNELNRKAKMLGGWYSSFKKSDAGFQFKSLEIAHRFTSLLDGDADRTDVLANRQARKLQSNAERLRDVATTLNAAADEILLHDDTRLKNTVRRADMAAGMRGRAYADQAMAKTLCRIADALDSHEAKYLDGIWAGTHVRTLIQILRRGKFARNKTILEPQSELSMWERHTASEELQHRPLENPDARFAEYPYPRLPRHELERLIDKATNLPGMKQRSARMRSLVTASRDEHQILFVRDVTIEFVTDYLSRAKAHRLDTRWLDSAMEDYKRLKAAHIDTPEELRCALRELIPFVTKKQEDDPVRKAEEALIGKTIPGFFPTPRSIISRMLELAEISPEHRVLEPSAGKGDILDLVKDHHPDVELTAIELNSTLHEVLSLKGHEVIHGDFLEHRGEYDRVIMNPPFENAQDIDHVQHAYAQLAAGGRLVSVMSEGPFFRQDSKASEFRRWLDELNATTEELPHGAFQGVEAFRQTGVKTRLVIIDK